MSNDKDDNGEPAGSLGVHGLLGVGAKRQVGRQVPINDDNDDLNDSINNNERTTTILSLFEKGTERLLQLDPSFSN